MGTDYLELMFICLGICYLLLVWPIAEVENGRYY